MAIVTPDDVLSYWFGDIAALTYPELKSELWWAKKPEVDAFIKDRFGPTWQAAKDGELAPWSETPRGRLAHVIVLDQLARNMHRETPDMYLLDDEAQDLVLQGLLAADDRALTRVEATFMYMPLMHAENVAMQRLCVRLFARMEKEARPVDVERAQKYLDFARQHLVIVERFGRFPHRNQILGRESTAEETEFLKEPGSGF